MGKVAERKGVWGQRAATEVEPRIWALHNILTDSSGEEIDVQNPLPTDGDSVYCKDVWEEESSIGNFSGSVCDLFDSLHSVIVDDTSNNPKEIIVHFNRTTPTTVIGLGAFSGNYSNVKIIALVTGEVAITLIDESANNTKYTSRQFDLSAVGFNALKIQFHTADVVSLSNLFIIKASSVTARIVGQKPDDTFTEVQVTAGGNFKTSLEELESDISVNSNTQLKTTIFDSSGEEAGVDSVSSALKTIDVVHHEIHESNHYFYTDWLELDATETLEIIYEVPNTTTRIHSLLAVSSTAQVEIDAYEGAIAGTDGTEVTPLNSDRDSANTAEVIIRLDPTVTNDGDVLYSFSLGTGTNPASIRGGGVSREDEIMLRTNTKYLVRFTSNTNSNRIGYRFFWYEHVDSN